jgi:hypothetical protein
MMVAVPKPARTATVLAIGQRNPSNAAIAVPMKNATQETKTLCAGATAHAAETNATAPAPAKISATASALRRTSPNSQIPEIK